MRIVVEGRASPDARRQRLVPPSSRTIGAPASPDDEARRTLVDATRLESLKLAKRGHANGDEAATDLRVASSVVAIPW